MKAQDCLHTMSFECEYNEEWINEIHVNEWTTISYAKQFEKPLSEAFRKLESLLLLKALTLVDLTTLSGDDTVTNISALVNKALHPVQTDLVQKILDSVISLIEKVKIVRIEDEYCSKVRLCKKNDQNYAVKISGKPSNDREFNDLNLEDFLELRELLTLFDFLNCDINKRLTEFLCLKNEVNGHEKQYKKMVYVGGICVFPALVNVVAENLKARGLNKHVERKNLAPKNQPLSELSNNDCVPIVAVAAGFPAGLYDLESKKREISFAINNGADEIDIVISRYLVLGNRWQELFDEIKELKKTCGKVTMKTILSVGECGSLDNVYKASMVAIMAGSNFIKTSTGKESVNATFTTGLVMCRAIKNFYMKTGIKIGFKPAGGIRTADDTLRWIKLILSELGPEWLSLFKIGASGVVDNIASRLKTLNS